MDVLLINPRSTYVKEIAQKVYPPLNLLYLAAALRARGYSVGVVEANAFRLSDEQIAQAVADAAPALVGVSVYTEILPQVRLLARLAKSAAPGCKVVFGGPHASAVPEQTLRDVPEADYLLCGEAEETLPALAALLRGSGSPESIPGLWRRRDGQTVSNPPAAGKADVARICPPARDLVERAYQDGRYYSLLVRARPIDTIITSRGCPFRCRFCYNTDSDFRGRSPADVLEELVAIRRRGIRDVEIVDDNFTTRRDRATRIFDLIIRERLGISFRIKSRVNVVDGELLALARRAGAYQVSYGAESGDQGVLDAMDKRITVEQIARAVRLTRQAGLNCHTSWICGFPGETEQTFARTVDLIVALKPTTANIGVLVPYPRTSVYNEAKRAGTLVGDWHPDCRQFPWVRLPWTQSRADLERLVARAKRRIYWRPHYAAAFGWMAVRNTNWTLARYAWQELRRSVGR